MDSVKCVVVGDSGVGKSCMLIAYTREQFPAEFTPRIFENESVDIIVDGRSVSLDLWDTMGSEDYERLRPLSYPGTDVFLACYSIVNPASLQSIKSMWLPELTRYVPEALIILVGTKSDLRNDRSYKTFVEEEDVSRMVEEVGARGHIECSALICCDCLTTSDGGVKKVFKDVARSVLYERKKQKRKKAGCNII